MNQQAILDLTKRLVAIRTVNYNPAHFPTPPDGMTSPGEEHKLVDFVALYLQRHYIPYSTFVGLDNRPSLIAHIGQQTEGARQLLIAFHSDTVPSEAEKWTSIRDPFAAQLIDDYIYGRGTLDNKGPMAAGLEAAVALKAIESELLGTVMIGIFPDEEVGGSAGLRKIIDESIITPTDAIIPDVGGDMQQIVVAEKGRVVLDVAVTGKAAHGSTPYAGKSAIEAMARYIAILHKYPLFDFLIPFPPFDHPTTVNYGIITGGGIVNNVADTCQVTLDIRFTPDQTPDSIIAELHRRAKFLTKEGYDVNIRYTPGQVVADPFVLQGYESSPLVRAIQKSSGAQPIGIGGGTVSKHLAAKGIMSVGWGPGSTEHFHVPNEMISLSRLHDFAEALVSIVPEVINQYV
ncbi:MAG: M20/M25/M40 family metallo-hydrolase [Candidatus Woesearchaeota archaeon]